MLYKHKDDYRIDRKKKKRRGKLKKRRSQKKRLHRRGTITFSPDLVNRATLNEKLKSVPHRTSLRTQVPSTKTLSFAKSMKGVSRKRLLSLAPSYTYLGVDEETEDGSNKCVRLMKAIEANNLEEMAKLLEGDLQPWDLIDFSSYTHVLHMAARYAEKETLDLLFQQPEIMKLINTKDVRGTTPLIAAAWYNNLVAVEYLLERGADTTAAIIETKKTVLHCAADLNTDEITREILRYNKKKFFLNSVDNEGNSALMIAVGADAPSIYVLFRAGSDYRKKNIITGRNILHQAILNRNHSLIRMMVVEFSEKEFVDSPDNTGDTPLMTALRIEDDVALKILLESQHAEIILPRAQLSLHMLVETGKTRIFLLLLDMIENKAFFNYVDGTGRTVLLYAVELSRVDMMMAMVNGGVNYKIRNYKTGETICHVAAYSNNGEILNFLLELEEISELMKVKDHSGITPCEILLAKADRYVWRKFIMHGLLPFRYFNDANESSLFIAAKEGNYNIVLSVLLSEKFNHLFEIDSFLFNKQHLYQLELQGLIYTSDLYLILGIDIKERGWKRCPEHEELFQYNLTGQNIFHACALGKNLKSLQLIYNFCLYYNVKRLEDLDKPDMEGNTPLSYAMQCGARDICKFFLKKGSDLLHENKSKESALEIMIGTLPNFQLLLREVIDEFVTFDITNPKSYKQFDDMKIVYDAVCPNNRRQMSILSHMFETLRGSRNVTIIQNPVLDYFIRCKWSRIRNLVGVRFFLFALLVVLLSTYISISYTLFLIVHPLIMHFLLSTIYVLSVVITLFSIPNFIMFFHNKDYIFTFIAIATPVLILIFIHIEAKTRTALEVAAGALLFGWFTVLIKGSVFRMSHQIAMFFEVLKHVSGHLPMCLILLYAFSNCCFLLYHDFYAFNNPLRSFITTSVLLLHSYNTLPVFNPDMKPMHNKKNVYKALDDDAGKIDGKVELHGMFVEGIILLLFDVLVSICFLNMLIGLAVRSEEELELEGRMYRARTYVKEIHSWEVFVDSRFYNIVRKLKLSWIIGVPDDLKERLKIPTVHIPLSDTYLPNYNFQKLRKIASSVQSRQEEEWFPFAAEMLLEQKSKTSIETMSSEYTPWIRNEKSKTIEKDPKLKTGSANENNNSTIVATSSVL